MDVYYYEKICGEFGVFGVGAIIYVAFVEYRFEYAVYFGVRVFECG